MMLMILGFNAVNAQNQISFARLTIDEGLSQNAVFCIIQDRHGFIWAGTEDGLNKYDGYKFNIYKHENANPSTLSNSQINALLEDKYGNLWIGTSDGLNIFNREKETFTRINTRANRMSEATDFITCLFQDSRNNLWIGTTEGLKRFDYRTKKVSSYKLPAASNVAGSNKIQTIYEDKDQVLWVSIGKDLKRFNPVEKKFADLPQALAQNNELRRSTVRVIRQDTKGNFWFGTETSGLFKFDPHSLSFRTYKHIQGNNNSLPISIVRELFVVSNSEIWVGTREGLSIFNPETEVFSNYQYNPYDPKTLSHNSVRNIMKDKAGNIWIGTFAGGINIFHSSGKNFYHIGEQVGRQAGLSHRVVSSILVADNGVLWIGTEGGGLNYIDRKSSIYKSYVINSRQQNIVKSLAKDKNGNIWIGTYDGLSHLNTKTGTFKNFNIPENDEKPGNNQIYALAADEGGVWIGTDGRGLNFIDEQGKQKATYVHNPKNKETISNNSIITLKKDKQNNIWIGTERGLNYFNKKTKKFTQYLNNVNDPYSLSHNSVISLFFDNQNRMWIGTEGGGLNLYDRASNRFYSITENQGLANNVIHAIRQDKSGSLWLSSNKGLSKILFKGASLPFRKENLEILNYTVEDGLQSNQFSTGSAEAGSNGELFFGGINGITAFYPDKIIKNRFKPNVVITDFLIKNNPVTVGKNNSGDSPLQKPITETESITLTHDQAFITFRFAALNYENSDKNEYAYKLNGFADDDWHYVGNQRTATYTNLDAGKYVFQVKASNNDGVWNDEVREITIHVLPPWWKTWYAYLMYTLIIAGLLYLFYYYSLKTAKLKNDLVFEHMSHEKDQELAQRKLSFFTNISHEIKTPLTLILAPIEKLIGMDDGNNKIQNQLMLMQRNGERLIRLINQLLDFRKFETGSMALEAAEGNIVRFIKEVLLAFDSYAKNRKVKISLSTEKDRIRLWFDRDKMEKVIYNLLSNALKFTQENGTVNVRIRTEKGEDGAGSVIIEVEDDGVGIAPENIKKIFDPFNHFDQSGVNPNGTGIGLSFSKGLVELHHGEIRVESTPAVAGGKGLTCFSIKLPLGKKHLAETEIIQNYKDSENISAYSETEIPLSASVKLIERKQHVTSSNDKEKLIMLIVEDNEEVLNFVGSHFEDDFEIQTATNGVHGLEKALQFIPDIIISDVMMPEMTGTTLCTKLKSDARTSHIPVILLTARTPLIFKIEGLETGADDYITKPFNLNILEARVWNLLESRQLLRERYRKEINLQPVNVAITSPDEKFLSKAMSYIEKNIAESNLSVEDLGREVGMSRVTLYRKIKALTNQSAVEFIRTIRLKRAAQLLEQNKLNVSEIAYMVGFMDIDYFRRCFKEQYGYTPKEYAQNAEKVS